MFFSKHIYQKKINIVISYSLTVFSADVLFLANTQCFFNVSIR